MTLAITAIWPQPLNRIVEEQAVTRALSQHWYFTSHEFNDAQSCRDRREWLTKELELRETRE